MSKPKPEDDMGAAPTETEADYLETPGAVGGLDRSVRNDLDKVRRLFVRGARLLEGLEEAVRVLPSQQSRIKAWRNQMDEILRGLDEESAEVSRKLLGTEPTNISESVNDDLVIRLRTGTES